VSTGITYGYAVEPNLFVADSALFDSDRPIDPSIVDVDFQKLGYSTGAKPKAEPGKFGATCPIFEERFRENIIPKSDWDDMYETYKPNFAQNKFWQYDQDGEGTCTANNTAGCFSYNWVESLGRQYAVAPSPISIYKYCARGPNTGSTMECCLNRIRDYGCLLIDNAANRKILEGMGLNPDHVLKAVGYYQKFPRGAMDETAPYFKVDEYYEIKTVEGFFTALFKGYDVSYGRSGHSIHGVDVAKRNGNWYCKYDNSWGRWGDNGFGYDSFNYIRRSGAVYGAYAIQSVRIPDEAIAKLMGVPSLGA